MLKFDVITETTTDGAKYGVFLHEHNNKGYSCKLCQIADEDMYVCLVEVVRDGETIWVSTGSAYYGLSDIEDDRTVPIALQYAIDELLDDNPDYLPTYMVKEVMRPFKDVAELYSVYAKEKQWTMQVDLQGDVVRLDTIAAIPIFFKRKDEAAINRVNYWGRTGVNGITWQGLFDYYELVTWYDFRTNDYKSIPCGILQKN